MNTSTCTDSIITETSSITANDDIEKNITGIIITINKLKHYAFLKRIDNETKPHIFAREASIIKNDHRPNFYIGDKCKFDIKRTSKGFEAININIMEINPYRIPKLTKKQMKKKNYQKPIHNARELFQSTITNLFHEALKSTQ
ncbi:unnamed protein product [Rotaria magnacalcarata]|uniref:Uncharacterized protein n=1 Tax=Rotaria magnacalcarata TaxID=392030 RepID=A0A815BBQ6_9BILA|nr:unnamed protein product [Rotaria magnacalcarata]CAF1568743.1 unnamed protein product [Rotaria magnacalcarata]CAF2198555.1 unnamed protein product [Rotaria magnacalcarata]